LFAVKSLNAASPLLMSSRSNGSSGERHIQSAVSALRGNMFGQQAKSM